MAKSKRQFSFRFCCSHFADDARDSTDAVKMQKIMTFEISRDIFGCARDWKI